jgi:hypothetical protein
MEPVKRLVAKAHAPLKKEPPVSCREAKTIGFDTFKNSLFMFPDSRPEAFQYIQEVLPTLLPPPNKPEDSLKLYKSLNGQWLEFDFRTNTLYLCSTK